MDRMKSIESNEISDPFAALYSTGPQSQLYISGRLTILRAPSGICGPWLKAPPHDTWHRLLDSNSFLWLRSAINRAIESGNITPGFEDAQQTLEHIAAVGIEYGSFTAEEIAEHRTAPDWYSFSDGLPAWADGIWPDF
jgi:hypothetical protein